MIKSVFRVPKRFAGQEINPIIYRLNYNCSKNPLPFDRNTCRTWNHVMYAPLETQYEQVMHYSPMVIQGLRLKKYLEGYLKSHDILIGTPQIYRAISGNLVRLFVYNPKNSVIDWKNIESALEKVFGQFQGPGTSGRNLTENEIQGRVKTRLDLVDVTDPLYNADILAQYVLKQLNSKLKSTVIFDRLVQTLNTEVRQRRTSPGASFLEVAGFRLRIKGRPNGEEMAVKHDFLHGSCPKSKQSALMDFGKHFSIMRSGSVGVKAWVHFQRPHVEDEAGAPCRLSEADNQELVSDKFPALLNVDTDYDSNRIPKYKESEGLWNVSDANDPEIRNLVEKMKELQSPDFFDSSRTIW